MGHMIGNDPGLAPDNDDDDDQNLNFLCLLLPSISVIWVSLGAGKAIQILF